MQVDGDSAGGGELRGCCSPSRAGTTGLTGEERFGMSQTPRSTNSAVRKRVTGSDGSLPRGFFSLMFSCPIRGYVPSPAAHRVALDRFDDLAARMSDLIDADAVLRGDPYEAAASHWATCHGHVGLEISRVGPVDIDWETALLRSLDALRLTMS